MTPPWPHFSFVSLVFIRIFIPFAVVAATIANVCSYSKTGRLKPGQNEISLYSHQMTRGSSLQIPHTKTPPSLIIIMLYFHTPRGWGRFIQVVIVGLPPPNPIHSHNTTILEICVCSRLLWCRSTPARCCNLYDHCTMSEDFTYCFSLWHCTSHCLHVYANLNHYYVTQQLVHP